MKKKKKKNENKNENNNNNNQNNNQNNKEKKNNKKNNNKKEKHRTSAVMGVTGSASASTESSTSTAQSEENKEEEEENKEENKEEEEEEEQIPGKKSHDEDEIPPGLEQKQEEQQEEDPTFPWLAIVERAAEGMASGQVRMYDIALTRETVLRLSRMPVVAHGLLRRSAPTLEADDEDICAAILQKDPRLQRLRYRSVPSLCSERTFWSVYSARMLRMIEATMCTEVG